MTRRGLSVAETVVAMFILVAAMLVLITLFHAGLRQTTRVKAQAIAANLARNRVEQLRGWANAPAGGGFNYDDWSPYADVTVTDPAFPEYQVRIRSLGHRLYSPCSLFESEQTDPVYGNDLAQRVEVTVSWDDQNLRLTTLVGAPRRLWGSPALSVTPNSAGPLSPGTSVDFSVQGLRAGNTPIPGLVYQWYVEPQTGNGTILPTRRDGSTARFTHQVLSPTGAALSAPGTCLVHVRAVYGGEEKDVVVGPILLSP